MRPSTSPPKPSQADDEHASAPTDTADSEPWSLLPEDAVVRVLSRLTVPQLCRVRTVCKQWNALTCTPEFRKLCSNHHAPYFPIVIARRFYMGDLGICFLGKDDQAGNDLFRVFFGFDHDSGSWQRLPPMDFLPREARFPVASAGGILCFRGPTSLFLCNPATRACEELPAITYKWPPSVSVHLVPGSGGHEYEVIVVGKIRHNFMTDDAFRTVAVFSSATRAWRVVAARQSAKVFSFGPTAAVCDGRVWCEAICRCGQLGVVAYHIAAEAWQPGLHEVPADHGRGDYQLTQVVECGGCVYMVITRGFGGVPMAMFILQLLSPSPPSSVTVSGVSVPVSAESVAVSAESGVSVPVSAESVTLSAESDVSVPVSAESGVSVPVSVESVAVSSGSGTHRCQSERDGADGSGGRKWWREVARLGDEMLEDLQNQWYGDDDADVACVAHGARICISVGVNLILVFDLGSGAWSKVPPCSSQLFELGVNFSAEPMPFPIQLRY